MAKFNVDMTNVEDGFTLVPEGDYVCKVAKITVEDGTKAKYLKWELLIGLGEFKGQKLYNNTSLAPQALFALRNSMIACGIEVPKSTVQVDTDKLIGKVVGVSVIHKKVDGKDRANVSEIYKVVKGEKGYKKAGEAAIKKVVDNTPDEDVPWAGNDNSVSGIVNDVEEIDI